MHFKPGGQRAWAQSHSGAPGTFWWGLGRARPGYARWGLFTVTYGPELTCIVAWVRCVGSVMACGYLRHLQGRACAMKKKTLKQMGGLVF